MRVRLAHGHSSSGGPAQKTVLDQVGFVDILYGSAVLSYSRCQGVQTYGTPGKFFYNGPQQQPVGLIQTVFISTSSKSRARQATSPVILP